MEFSLPNKEKIRSKHSEDDKGVAYAFAARIYKELDRMCRAIVLFGSVAEQDAAQHEHAFHKHPHSQDRVGDIDILIILDDVTVTLSPEVQTAYRLIVEQSIRDISSRIHVTTVPFTTFWEYVRVADPVMVNVLRSGEALIDTGFFEPMQHLLRQGRIRPSEEAVWSYYLRSPQTLRNSQGHILQGCLDLYWCVIDAAHAALMAAGETPSSPKETANLLRHVYVSKGLLDEHYAQTMEKFYSLSKDITHRNIGTISGEYYDQLYILAREFMEAMRAFLPSREPDLQ